MHSGVFLYPLKIIQNIWFLMFSGSLETDQWHKNGQKGNWDFFKGSIVFFKSYKTAWKVFGLE